MDVTARRRLIITATICAPFGLYGWAILAATATGHDGVIGPRYGSLGSDWAIFYTAARAWFTGHLSNIYDQIWLKHAINADLAWWLTQPLPYPAFHYPPTFLLLILLFALLPFLAAYLSFQAATAIALAASVKRAIDRAELPFLALALLLAPASSNNLLAGQNAFLILALLLFGFHFLEKRPLAAGIAFGLLAIKPQMGLMVPVALTAARQWRVLGATAATALVLSLASLAVFGTEFWQSWIGVFLHPRADVAYTGVDWGRLWDESVFTCASLLGASKPLANLCQAAAVLLAAAFVYLSFRDPGHTRQKLCVLLAATVVASPHLSPYDMVLLALAGAVTLWDVVNKPDFRPFHAILPAVLWVLPLINPPRAVALGLTTPLWIFGFLFMAAAPCLIKLRRA